MRRGVGFGGGSIPSPVIFVDSGECLPLCLCGAKPRLICEGLLSGLGLISYLQASPINLSRPQDQHFPPRSVCVRLLLCLHALLYRVDNGNPLDFQRKHTNYPFAFSAVQTKKWECVKWLHFIYNLTPPFPATLTLPAPSRIGLCTINEWTCIVCNEYVLIQVFRYHSSVCINNTTMVGFKAYDIHSG